MMTSLTDCLSEKMLSAAYVKTLSDVTDGLVEMACPLRPFTETADGDRLEQRSRGLVDVGQTKALNESRDAIVVYWEEEEEVVKPIRCHRISFVQGRAGSFSQTTTAAAKHSWLNSLRFV